MEQYLGQIQAFGFDFPPRGWSFCDGALLSIANNSALFSLLGTTFGGDGRNTFALPDLRGRSIVHPGQGPGLSTITWGQKGGNEAITLTVANMPAHTHTMATVQAHTTIGTSAGGAINETDNGNYGFGSGGSFPNMFSESTPGNSNPVGGVTTTLSGTPTISGGSQPFGIRNPFVGIYMSIATVGIFPSRN